MSSRTAFAALVLGLAVLAAPALHAQESERVLRSWTDTVKLPGGGTDAWTFTITYDAEAGEYAQTVRDGAGALVERRTSPYSMASPTAEELDAARALILADPELRALYDAAANPTLEGGFELVREESDHPCGPGSRCLQFDLFDVDAAVQRVERIRYVVVDLRDGTIVARDLDPRHEANLTRFNTDLR